MLLILSSTDSLLTIQYVPIILLHLMVTPHFRRISTMLLLLELTWMSNSRSVADLEGDPREPQIPPLGWTKYQQLLMIG